MGLVEGVGRGTRRQGLIDILGGEPLRFFHRVIAVSDYRKLFRSKANRLNLWSLHIIIR
jgi:hypothetical protein